MWDEVVDDHKLITGGQETKLDQVIAQSQPSDFFGPNNISVTNKNTINQFQLKVVESIPFKKANKIKWKWTKIEDMQVF